MLLILISCWTVQVTLPGSCLLSLSSLTVFDVSSVRVFGNVVDLFKSIKFKTFQDSKWTLFLLELGHPNAQTAEIIEHIIKEAPKSSTQESN